MFGFGKKDEPVPEGQGMGPTFTAPDPLIPGPYIHPGRGYAPDAEPIADQWQQYSHHDSPAPGSPPGDWGKYHTDRVAAYGEERSVSVPSPSRVDEKSRADDPRWNPVPVDRPTRSPSTYRFFRLFDVWAARRLTGEHFSMADQKRTYPIGGMTPARERGRRNTYRLSPEPWDENIVDRVTPSAPVNSTYVMDDDASPSSGTRSWRL
jgi:hypothetical protein